MVTSSEILLHVQQLRRYARLLCGSAADADDLVQSSLERAIRNAGKFRDGRDLRVWLFAILHNTFRSSVRENRARRNRETSWSENGPGSIIGSQEVSAELSLVLNAIGKLPAQQREVLLLVSIEGFSTEEIALTMDLPVGTVRSRLARGRELLRRMLESGTSALPLTLVGGRDAG